jgi:acetyltransferase-like isoleucine patch superfamily enzyme
MTYPGEVVALEGSEAVVRTDGRFLRATTLVLPDTAIGDQVLVAAGSIVHRLEPLQAEEIRRLVAIADGSQEIDRS